MNVTDVNRELKAVVVLSVLICFFSVGIIVKVAIQLTKETHPFHELKLMIICNVGFAAYSILGWLKLNFGRKVQSRALIMDAYSTFAAAAMSLGLLFSLVVYHFTKLWFL